MMEKAFSRAGVAGSPPHLKRIYGDEPETLSNHTARNQRMGSHHTPFTGAGNIKMSPRAPHPTHKPDAIIRYIEKFWGYSEIPVSSKGGQFFQ